MCSCLNAMCGTATGGYRTHMQPAGDIHSPHLPAQVPGLDSSSQGPGLGGMESLHCRVGASGLRRGASHISEQTGDRQVTCWGLPTSPSQAMDLCPWGTRLATAHGRTDSESGVQGAGRSGAWVSQDAEELRGRTGRSTRQPSGGVQGAHPGKAFAASHQAGPALLTTSR